MTYRPVTHAFDLADKAPSLDSTPQEMEWWLLQCVDTAELMAEAAEEGNADVLKEAPCRLLSDIYIAMMERGVLATKQGQAFIGFMGRYDVAHTNALIEGSRCHPAELF